MFCANIWGINMTIEGNNINTPPEFTKTEGDCSSNADQTSSKTESHDLQQWTSWVVYKLIPRKDKRPRKVPIDPVTGRNLHWQDKSQWLTHEQAAAFARQGIGNGIGFVLSKDDPFVMVDLDDCINADGGLTATARRIVDQLDTMTEITPSAKGLRIIAVGKKSLAATVYYCDGMRVDIMDSNAFMTVTGNTFESRCAILSRQQKLDELMKTFQTDSTRSSSEKGAKSKSNGDNRSALAYSLIRRLHKKGMAEKSILAELKKSKWWSHYTSEDEARADIRRTIQKVNHIIPNNPNPHVEWNPPKIALSDHLRAMRDQFSVRYYDVSGVSYDHILSLYENLIVSKSSAVVAVPAGAGKSTSMVITSAAYASPQCRFLIVKATVDEIRETAEQLRSLGCRAIEWHSWEALTCTQAEKYWDYIRLGGTDLCKRCRSCTAVHRQTAPDRFDDSSYDVIVCSKAHYKMALALDRLGGFAFVFHDEEPELFGNFKLDRLTISNLRRMFENNRLISDAFENDVQKLKDDFATMKEEIDTEGNVSFDLVGGGHADRVISPFSSTLAYEKQIRKAVWNKYHSGHMAENDLAIVMEFIRFFNFRDIWCMATIKGEMHPKNIKLHFMSGSNTVKTGTPTAILNASAFCSPILWEGFQMYTLPSIQPNYENTRIVSRFEQPTQSAIASARHASFEKMVVDACAGNKVGWLENAHLDRKRIEKNVLKLKAQLPVTASLSIGRARGSNLLRECSYIVADAGLFKELHVYVLTAAIVGGKRIDADRIWCRGQLLEKSRFASYGFIDSEIQRTYTAMIADELYQLALRGIIRSDPSASFTFCCRIPNIHVAFFIQNCLMQGAEIDHEWSEVEREWLSGKAIAEIASMVNPTASILSDHNRIKKIMAIIKKLEGEDIQDDS